MELHTISVVSKNFGISTRMLRYYEQIGLLQSIRKEDYSYRVYDKTALRRLQQIIILRKLRVPVKQIGMILNNSDVAPAIEVFQQNIQELNQEIDALKTIKDILHGLVNELQKTVNFDYSPELLADETMLELLDVLSLPKNLIKGEISVVDLNKANESLSKLQDVRIIYIPPMVVASSHCMGENCEMHAGMAMDKFVLESGLLELKPDLRHFGFNNPVQNTTYGSASTGYEIWVSIPDNMEVPAPLTKIQFHGGLYAAHAIQFGNFDHWGLLNNWVTNCEQYTSDWGSVRCTPHLEGMDWAMEEQLNYINNIQNPKFDFNTMQLDLLFPIKEREQG